MGVLLAAQLKWPQQTFNPDYWPDIYTAANVQVWQLKCEIRNAFLLIIKAISWVRHDDEIPFEGFEELDHMNTELK